ncbi:MAG: hypothetical protein O3A22_03945 [Bacteroidetes bacterium]|jgi:hypothetical protein|nr:hypothetical protein [Bacteroidota bacterium]
MNQTNNQFNRDEHLMPSIKAALYYLLVYIPILLPLSIWKDASVSLTNLWQTRSVSFDSSSGKYPLWSLLYKYVITFVFDAAILLAWPYVLYQAIFEFEMFHNLGSQFEYLGFVGTMKYLIMTLLGMYTVVIFLRLAKEALNFVLGIIVTWIFDVISSLGKMMVPSSTAEKWITVVLLIVCILLGNYVMSEM